jgi:Protein of unknown function (DUF2490)
MRGSVIGVLSVRLLILIWLLMAGESLAAAQGFQSWNEVDVTASWKHVDFLFPFQPRTDTRLPNPQLAAGGAEADFGLPWRLTLTGGYLAADLPQRSEWVHLPLVALTKSFQWRRFSLADRNRFERLVGFGTSPVRYRNRLFLDRAFGARDAWHLFVDDEVLFDLSAGKWSQNRAQVGGGARLSRRLFLDVYYLRRNVSGGGPATNVIGNILKVALTPR